LNSSINLHEQLLTRGRRLLELGSVDAARTILHRLLDQPEVSKRYRAEAHTLLGQIALDFSRFDKARRHYAAAIGLRPFAAEGYVRYAMAIEADPDGNTRKAWLALRRATRIDPEEPRYWTALGRTSLLIGDRTVAGLAFRRAARLQPDCINVLTELVGGYVAMGQFQQAKRVLIAVRFRYPRLAGLAELWKNYRWHALRRRQQRLRMKANSSDESTIPFPGRSTSVPTSDPSPVVLRADQSSWPRPHVLRLFGRQSQ
jgi:Flp pilus assembly protein TadD